jgi:hypothetical protein
MFNLMRHVHNIQGAGVEYAGKPPQFLTRCDARESCQYISDVIRNSHYLAARILDRFHRPPWPPLVLRRFRARRALRNAPMMGAMLEEQYQCAV